VRILILGGAGMLGHKLHQVLRERFDVWVTLRSSLQEHSALGLFEPARTLTRVDAMNLDSVIEAFGRARPDVVINCVGVIKQLASARDPIVSLSINSLFPHRLVGICHAVGARLIHISTDCVFAGRGGSYAESDTPDAEDLYGRTKLLGEPSNEASGVLTLRTSIIGRELRTTSGLMEWLLSHRGGTVRGFTHAIFSGLSTRTLGRLIADVVERHEDLSGLYHVATERISKYHLLCRLNEAFGARITVEPSAEVQIDRSLDSRRFWASVGLSPPTWPSMIQDMAEDSTPYDTWRRSREP
jgi:dTDP-4-dehydrorhamnose reductase